MIKKELLEKIKGQLEPDFDQLVLLIPKMELRENTRLKKRIAQMRKTFSFLREMKNPGSVRRANQKVSRARTKGSQELKCYFSKEV